MHLERIGCSVFWVSERGGEPKFPNPRSTLCPRMYQSQLPAVQLSPELRSASGQSLHLEPLSGLQGRQRVPTAAPQDWYTSWAPGRCYRGHSRRTQERRGSDIVRSEWAVNYGVRRAPVERKRPALAIGLRKSLLRRKDRSSNSSDYAPENDRTGQGVTIRQIYNRQISQDMKIAGSIVETFTIFSNFILSFLPITSTFLSWLNHGRDLLPWVWLFPLFNIFFIYISHKDIDFG